MAQGTAFFLKEVGLVTAAHCVEGVEEVHVYHSSKLSNVFKAKVIKFDTDRDLAILQHKIPATEYFELEPSMDKVKVGDDMIALGYPDFGPGDRLNVRECKVNSLPVKSAMNYIEVSQNLAQGMSGGPVLDSGSSVAGIIYKGGPGKARNLAISIEVLNSWLAEKP